MDLIKQTYHGQLTINGTTIQLGESNLVIHLRSLLQALQSHSVSGHRGQKTITVVWSDSLGGLTTSNPLSIESNSLESLVIDESPREGEDFESYRSRLCDQGHTPESALFFANDWYSNSQDTTTQRWIDDSKVKRFLELQGSQKAYDEALPQEYASLRNYVQTNYPEFAERITFRSLK